MNNLEAKYLEPKPNFFNRTNLERDGLGMFFCVDSGNYLKNERTPIVFINGQMDSYIQALETQTLATKNSCFQSSRYWQYDESKHIPYIWIYDYPILKGNKHLITTDAFVYSVAMFLEKHNLENVTIMGTSVGGIIALKLSQNPRVVKSIALHPPILGTPLINDELIKKYSKKMTFTQMRLYNAVQILVDKKFGVHQESMRGHVRNQYDITKFVNLDKSTIVTSSINGCDKGFLANNLRDIITITTNQESDAVTIVDNNYLRKKGYNIVEDETPSSHFELNKKYNANLYKKLL